MTKTITIIGNVGSGKTTLAKILSKKISAIFIDAEMYTSNPFLPLYVKDHARWALATELFYTSERAKYLTKELSKNISKTKIIDSGLLMGIEVYAKHHLKAGTMTIGEWSLFKKLTKESINSKIIYPDLVIYCRCDIPTCLERIKNRGREFENYHSYKYLKDLENNLSELVKKLKREEVRAIVLDMKTFDPRIDAHIKYLIKEVSQYDS